MHSFRVRRMCAEHRLQEPQGLVRRVITEITSDHQVGDGLWVVRLKIECALEGFLGLSGSPEGKVAAADSLQVRISLVLSPVSSILWKAKLEQFPSALILAFVNIAL